MNSDRICYTCLKSDSKQLVDVYKTDFDKISYVDKLKTCLAATKLRLTSVMELCWPCMTQLRISYKFIEMVKSNQEVLATRNEKSQVANYCSNIVKDESNIYVSMVKLRSENDKHKSVINLIKESRTETVKTEQSNLIYDSDSSDYFLADLRSNDAPNSVNTYSCKKCDKVYLTLAEITEHQCEAIHEFKESELSRNGVDKVKTNCKENKAQKTTKKVRNRPQKYTKKQKPDTNYNCDQCGVSFNKMWKVKKHTARVHVQDKKYVCTYCDRGFKQSYHLREHLTSHTGERNYTCTYCDKTFQRISSQRRHIRSHEAAPGQKTKRTPFLCTICGKSFPFSNGVQRHMKIHLGIKPHECHQCKRKFTQSTHLHVHMRTHTGEKPYVCHACGEAFSLNATLQKHMSNHQNVNKNTFVSDLSRVFLVQETR